MPCISSCREIHSLVFIHPIHKTTSTYTVTALTTIARDNLPVHRRPTTNFRSGHLHLARRLNFELLRPSGPVPSFGSLDTTTPNASKTQLQHNNTSSHVITQFVVRRGLGRRHIFIKTSKSQEAVSTPDPSGPVQTLQASDKQASG